MLERCPMTHRSVRELGYDSHTSPAMAIMLASFRHWSSGWIVLPWTVEEKPHW
jgi:hypothetical protein